MKGWKKDFYVDGMGVYCPLCGKWFSKFGIASHIERSHYSNYPDCSWNRGLTKETDERVKKNTDSLKKYFHKNGSHWTGRKHKKETKDKISKSKIQQLSNIPFYSKRCKVNGIILDSTYEKRFAESLNENNIEWIRPKRWFKWIDKKQQTRRYLPDFYLPEYDVYIDTKNSYLMRKDREKIENVIRDNGINLVVIDELSLDWKYTKEIIEIVS